MHDCCDKPFLKMDNGLPITKYRCCQLNVFFFGQITTQLRSKDLIKGISAAAQ